MSSTLTIILLLWGGIAMVGAVLLGQRGERTLAGRLELLRNAPRQRVAPVAEPDAKPDRQARALAAVQAMFTYRMRRNWGVSNRPVFLLTIGIVAAVCFWLFNQFAMHVPYFGVLGGAAVFFIVPRLLLLREQRRSDRQFTELLPDAIDMVVRIVRAGMPVGAAVRTVGQEATPPLSIVFARVADQASIGVPFDEALTRIAAAIGNADFRFFAVAVALQQLTGGNLAATLESLSTIIRRRRAVILKAHAATAEVRMSAIVLGAIPFVVTGALLLVAPNYLDPLFKDPRGNVILGMAIFLLIAAGLSMRTMIKNALAT
jgi:tight adherence protein B